VKGGGEVPEDERDFSETRNWLKCAVMPRPVLFLIVFTCVVVLVVAAFVFHGEGNRQMNEKLLAPRGVRK